MVQKQTKYLSPEMDIVLIDEDILTGSGELGGEFVEDDTSSWYGPEVPQS